MKLQFLKMLPWTLGGVALFALLPAAHAVRPAPTSWPVGDAVRGKAAYRVDCVTCHLGGDATLGIQKVNLGAGPTGATRLNNALLNNVGGMGFLEPRLSAQTISDMNAYLSNPSLSGLTSSASAAPTPVSFPATEVGSTNSATVTLSVAGSAVRLSSLAVSPSVYTITGGSCVANLVIPAAGSCTANVTFTPTQAGNSPAGTLTFNHDAMASPSTVVALSGSGTASPVGQVWPAKLSFAAQAVGSGSAFQVVTLSNSGNGALTLRALAVSSSNFLTKGGTCAPNAALAPSASCTVHVGFAPGAAGALSGSLTLTHDGGGGGAELISSVALSGVAVSTGPALVVSTSALSFSQMVGTTSAVRSVTLSNQGVGPLSLSDVSFRGANAADFLRSGGNCGVSLAPGASCTVNVVFLPVTVGARSASLALSHNGVGSPALVSLAGLATAAASPVLSLNTEALTFAAQAVSTSSTAQTMTLTNSGAAALTLSGLALGGPDVSSFVLGGGSCAVNVAIAPGTSCTVQVASRPGSVGAKVAHVSLTSNGVVGTVTVPVMGRGVVAAPAVLWSPSGVDFASAPVGGAPVTRVVRLSNVGGAPLTVSSLGVTGAGLSQTNTCGASVAAGASCNVSLSYAPSSAVALSGVLTLTSSAPGSTQQVGLNGQGISPGSVLDWATAPDGAFADTVVGSASLEKTFTLNNTSTSAATVRAVQVLGAEQGEFVLGGTCLSTPTVAAAGSCTVTVAMAPSAVGLRAAQLVLSSPGVAPAVVALNGRGVAMAQNAAAGSVSSLSFPATDVGKTAVLPWTVTNTGSVSLAVSGISATNAVFSAALSKQPGCVGVPLLLAPGASCALEVTYRATSLAAVNESLMLTTNMSSATQVALLANVSGGESVAGAVSTGPSNVGAGGCSLVSAQGSRVDPTLWLLCLAALAVLGRRSRSLSDLERRERKLARAGSAVR